MARYHYLIGILSLLLVGCAQVGTISGGDEDIFAPKPINEGVSPPNASSFFTSKKVEIPFDEFFTLNNPAQNIQIVPPHAKIKSKVKGKTLILSWDEDLEANTTYAIYLNRAVKDLSESNDSIMQYVFSTGSTLDSLSYSVSAVDARTNTAMKDILVGLYNPEDGTILNFAQTDRFGNATLSYLKERAYKLIAFDDENGDLIPQPFETVGFFEDSLIQLDSSFVSPDAFRMFKPLEKAKIEAVKFNPPSNFLIELNRTVENENIYLDGVLQAPEKYTVNSNNSITLYVNSEELISPSGEVVYQDDHFSDTASYRVLDAQKKGSVLVKPSNNGLFGPSDSAGFVVNDIITNLNSELITIRNSKDSTLLTSFIGYEKNVVDIYLNRELSDQYIVTFKEGAIETTNGTSKAFEGTVQFNSQKKYGSLSLDLSHYEHSIVLEVLSGTNIVDELELKPSDLTSPIVLTELSPGSYTFKIIHDSNYNGRWDGGDLKTRRQPEQVDIYSSPTKVRANWEVEVSLVPIAKTP